MNVANIIEKQVLDLYKTTAYQKLNAYYGQSTLFNVLGIERSENRQMVVMDGNEDVLRICGEGLNDDNQIVVIDECDEENGLVPDEWTHAYLEMYQFVVDNLAYAKQDPVLN